MERKEGYRGIILTLNNDKVGITDQEAEKKIKRLLSALRRKANREDWRYCILIAFSRSNQKIKQVRPHFHVFLHGDPCLTIGKWINNYWNPPKKSRRKAFGCVIQEKVKEDKAGYFVSGYIKDQAEFTREQKRGFEKLLNI